MWTIKVGGTICPSYHLSFGHIDIHYYTPEVARNVAEELKEKGVPLADLSPPRREVIGHELPVSNFIERSPSFLPQKSDMYMCFYRIISRRHMQRSASIH